MPRYKLTIEYNGGPYKGFQAQAEGLPTVQASLERAITAFSGETVRVHVAGRTDTGVHALAQVAHLDLNKPWRAEVVQNAINAHLAPEPIVVLDAEEVGTEFHARFSATERRYLYRILDRRAPAALERGRVWQVKTRLDAEAMHAAAKVLIGLHDFTTFRDVNCQASGPLRTLDQARVWRAGEEVHLAFAARSFLHRQVRSMTGTLAEVGLGRWTADEVAEALAAKDRARCGPVAPACGLYLAGVTFGESPA